VSSARRVVDAESRLAALVDEARGCRRCADRLPLGPRPVLRARASASLLIVGQAPGIKVHESGIPWNDASGRRLREWMNVDEKTFYDEARIAIIPAGLCYPGKGKSGDLPPIPECAGIWHARLRSHLPGVTLTLLLGQYAQAHYLRERRKSTLTKTVRAWREYLPGFLPLPHPSPRNTLWLRRNDWFESEVVPMLRERVRTLIRQEDLE
jgi:uracil-DNA glycosylase